MPGSETQNLARPICRGRRRLCAAAAPRSRRGREGVEIFRSGRPGGGVPRGRRLGRRRADARRRGGEVPSRPTRRGRIRLDLGAIHRTFACHAVGRRARARSANAHERRRAAPGAARSRPCSTRCSGAAKSWSRRARSGRRRRAARGISPTATAARRSGFGPRRGALGGSRQSFARSRRHLRLARTPRALRL